MQNFFEEIKKSVKELIEIPSIQGEAKENHPFGEEVSRALNYMLDLAKGMGFKTTNYDNYIGEIEWGEGEKTCGILCHVDVVPVGKLSDWKYPPFSATEIDGKIYGRGALDDKSPAVVCLYAMKSLKDEGFTPKNKIKLILGCNEESGWGCIDHYKKVAKMPDFGFSPDAEFPVLYAEKGILHVKFEFNANDNLKDVKGGERANVVCDYAEAITTINEEIAKLCNVKVENGKICSYGKTAHGSTPEKGENAILHLIKYLEKVNAVGSEIREYLFEDKLNLKSLNDDTGYLSMSPDIIYKSGNKLFIVVDFRYPSTLNGNEFLEKLKSIAPYEVLEHQLPLYNKKDSPMIQTLLKIYNDYTGQNLEPMAIGGGTYARALPIGVAFGPEMIGEESTIHQPNEYVSIENLKLQCVMYKQAIKELNK